MVTTTGTAEVGGEEPIVTPRVSENGDFTTGGSPSVIGTSEIVDLEDHSILAIGGFSPTVSGCISVSAPEEPSQKVIAVPVIAGIRGILVT